MDFGILVPRLIGMRDVFRVLGSVSGLARSMSVEATPVAFLGCVR